MERNYCWAMARTRLIIRGVGDGIGENTARKQGGFTGENEDRQKSGD